MGIFGGGPESVIKKGSRTSGRIVGIAFSERGDDPPTRIEEYAIELGDGRVVGVRQRLDPADVVRFGMPVTVWTHKDDAVIDWRTSTSSLGVTASDDLYMWKSVDAPDRGIRDSRLKLDKARSKWTPVAIVISEVRMESVAFGLAQRLVLDLVVTPPDGKAYACEVKEGNGIPYYASHLVTVGRRLEGFVDPGRPDKVRIDWPAAAMAEPGVGVPPVRFDHGEPNLAAAFGMPEHGAASAPGAAPAVVDAPPPIDGVSFDQWLSIERELRIRGLVSKPKQWDAVAAEFGVAPGSYAKASGKWGFALMRRPDLAAAYAAAIA